MGMTTLSGRNNVRSTDSNGQRTIQLWTDGQLYAYDSADPFSTTGTLLDANPKNIDAVIDGDDTYLLHNDGEVYRYGGSQSGWISIGNNPSTIQITAGGGKLYLLNSNGDVFFYSGSSWDLIDNNPRNVAIVSAGSRLFLLHWDGETFEYNGSAFNWTKIDQNPKNCQLASVGEQLYLLHSDGEVYQYGGAPFAWESIDNNPSTCGLIAIGQAICLIHGNGDIFVRVPNAGWPKVGQPLTVNSSLAAAERSSFFQNAVQALSEDSQLNSAVSDFQIPAVVREVIKVVKCVVMTKGHAAWKVAKCTLQSSAIGPEESWIEVEAEVRMEKIRERLERGDASDLIDNDPIARERASRTC